MNLKYCFVLVTATTLLTTSGGEFIAYDNTTEYEGYVTSRGNTEIGDEINLLSGPATMTRFQFEYSAVGITTEATGIVRFYSMKQVSAPHEQPFQPGTLLFESEPFPLLNGFHQGSIDNLSLDVPEKFVWSVAFSGLQGTGDNAGLLFYNGVEVAGGPGQSYDDHWEFNGSISNPFPHWQLVDNPGVIDNFAARVTTVPEPGCIRLMAAGVFAIGFAARRIRR
jgi:hypothetical protein